MKDYFEKVFLNEYGYYELKKKPCIEERKQEFEETYYQQSESTYEEQYTEEERRFFQNKLEQKRIMIEKNSGRPCADRSLLDIGCGEGFVLDYFCAQGMQVMGIDFSEWAIRHHNPAMLPFFRQGDCARIIPELAQQKCQFDVINMDSALDMMLEPGQIVELCKSILADDGILLVKVANNYSKLQQTLLETGQVAKEYWLDDPGHPSYFNKDGLCRFMKAHGLVCVDFYGESFIDFNLLNPLTNYYERPGVGKDCYHAKVQLENMMHEISPEKSLEVFRTLGEMGFGREITGLFQKQK